MSIRLSDDEAASARGLASPIPPLNRDPAFWGMTVTQFLGAFNDNLYKQLILLLTVAVPMGGQKTTDLQGHASLIFAIPFLAFSGFAGFLSDRYSKRTVVILCKLAEVVIMTAGVAAFWVGSLSAQLTILFFMGMHSAFFGPSKYGILPEMLRPNDLPRANGIFQMTTFLAIIFGFASAGWLLEAFKGSLMVPVGSCVAVALLGTATACLLRSTPPANSRLPLVWSSLLISPSTARMLWKDRQLLTVICLYSVFWFIGGVVQPTVNALGIRQLELGTQQTSSMVVSLAVGIAVGCLLAGKLSAGKVSFRLARLGAAGIVGTLLLLSLPSVVPMPKQVVIFLSFLGLTGLGISAGFFAVPLQVFIQTRADADQKGRIIGAMNLLTWIGIALSGVVFQASQWIPAVERLPSTMFALTAAIMLPVALFFHPPDTELG